MSSNPPSTLGFSSRKDWMSRLFRGRSWSCCSSRPRAIAPLSSVMLLRASAETVTDSVTAPSSSFASTRAEPAARSKTPVRSNFLNLGVVTSMR